MKKKSFVLILAMVLSLFFAISCSNATPHEHKLSHVEAKEATITEEGNIEYWVCQECGKKYSDESGKTEVTNVVVPKKTFSSMEELLELLEFEDQVITYDGEKHSIVYDGDRPEGVRIVCTPTTKYNKVGDYKYTLKVTYNNETAYKYAYLRIQKEKPTYLGKTAYTVYLNDPSTQPHFEFDINNVNVIDQPFYRETGTFKYTLKTEETDTMASVDPVEITYTVLDSKLNFEFKSQTLVTDGLTPVKIELTPAVDGATIDTSKYDIVYTDNSSNVQGHYYATAKVYEKGTQNLYEEYRAILTVDYPKNEAFESYVDQIFRDYLGDDQTAINLFLTDYKAFGFEHGDSTWETFEGFDKFTEEDYNHDRQEIANERETLEAFKAQKLSYGQLISYRRIDEYLQMYENMLKSMDYEYISLNYVDQYGGAVADFPTMVEAYSLRTIEDIEDYIKMINSTETAFASYYDYIVAKKDKGYGLSKFTLTSFNSYIDGVLSQFKSKDGYYLKGVVTAKIDEAKEKLGLTDEQYNNYKNQLLNGVNVVLYNALQDLYDKVDNFIKTNTYFDEKTFNNKYYGGTKLGQELYYAKLQNSLGIYDLRPADYLANLNAYLKYYHDLFMSVSSNSTEYADKIADGEVTVYDYGDNILNVFNMLYDFSDEVVYELESKPEIGITWMDPTTTVNTNTVAYYMKSPLDSFSNEYIHLNGRALSKNNYDTLSSIAHEGYPGHLYAFVNVKENDNLSNFVKIATYTGHAEGWTKYIEARFNTYLADIHKEDEHAADYEAFELYNNAWAAFVFLFYTRVDFGVNYEGWDGAAIVKFAKSQGLNITDGDDLFNTLNESAAQYPAYGYGQAMFLDIHERTANLLGAAYNEKELNQVILNQGWCSLDSLSTYVNEYLDQQAFLLGLEVENVA